MESLLGPVHIRQLANELDLRPAKNLGQNFVHDANTVRRIVQLSGVLNNDVVLEVGPGLGSLTIELVRAAQSVVAVEIDSRLAQQLPITVERYAPKSAERLHVVHADAITVTALPAQPTALVANLPYNVGVPIVLNLLERFATIEHGLVMVQTEVAQRLTAEPGTKIYGVPSAKLAWYADAHMAGHIPRGVFWPVPRVDSSLVAFRRHSPPAGDRKNTFSLVDAAFAQRRKTLRAALTPLLGSSQTAESALRAADIDPAARGETLAIADFARLAEVSASFSYGKNS